MLGPATMAKEVLLKLGLAAALLDDLAKALDRVEAEGNAINLSRRAHIGARVELGEVAANLSELVQVLDAFNRYGSRPTPTSSRSGMPPGAWWATLPGPGPRPLPRPAPPGRARPRRCHPERSEGT